MIVKIWEDPMTRKRFEGYAKVIRVISQDAEDGTHALVRLLHEKQPVRRLIHPRDWANRMKNPS